jgi:hypothetical protein
MREQWGSAAPAPTGQDWLRRLAADGKNRQPSHSFDAFHPALRML